MNTPTDAERLRHLARKMTEAIPPVEDIPLSERAVRPLPTPLEAQPADVVPDKRDSDTWYEP
jgi:hypothetical protein